MKNSDENRHEGLPASYIDLVEGAEGAARADMHAQAERAGGAAGEATRHPAAAGGRREAPALDLSLGHFGTSAYVDEVDYVSDGPYTLELDYAEMKATLTMDCMDPSSRAVRRASMRKLEKIIRVASQSGMRIVREVSHG